MPLLPSFLNRLFRPASPRPSSDMEASLTTGLPVLALQAQGIETDSTFFPGSNMSSNYRDRYDYDRQVIFAECLRAWRINPLARRIVKLISMFVVGEGIQVQSDDAYTNAFLQDWWNHPLNKLPGKVINFCDEATRSGNLFFLCTVDQATGYIYVRGVPADQVAEIVTAENDVDQELAYKPIEQGKPAWTAYDQTYGRSAIIHASLHIQPTGRRSLGRTGPGAHVDLVWKIFKLARGSCPPEQVSLGFHVCCHR